MKKALVMIGMLVSSFVADLNAMQPVTIVNEFNKMFNLTLVVQDLNNENCLANIENISENIKLKHEFHNFVDQFTIDTIEGLLFLQRELCELILLNSDYAFSIIAMTGNFMVVSKTLKHDNAIEYNLIREEYPEYNATKLTDYFLNLLYNTAYEECFFMDINYEKMPNPVQKIASNEEAVDCLLGIFLLIANNDDVSSYLFDLITIDDNLDCADNIALYLVRNPDNVPHELQKISNTIYSYASGVAFANIKNELDVRLSSIINDKTLTENSKFTSVREITDSITRSELKKQPVSFEKFIGKKLPLIADIFFDYCDRAANPLIGLSSLNGVRSFFINIPEDLVAIFAKSIKNEDSVFIVNSMYDFAVAWFYCADGTTIQDRVKSIMAVLGDIPKSDIGLLNRLTNIRHIVDDVCNSIISCAPSYGYVLLRAIERDAEGINDAKALLLLEPNQFNAEIDRWKKECFSWYTKYGF